MRRLTYRPEVDGLRALAVLAVVFFHTHLKMPGGYVGVDIFFVISGYLITALIAADLARGTFSLRNFWERRIRRIVPAATVTVGVCLLAGYFLMLPSDFAELGRSAVAQALVAANFHFYLEAGYFSAPADGKPLLHFWSLAVEEQFYLIFPFVLLMLHRWRKENVFRGVAVLAAASFGLSVVGVRYFPDATFYLLPARAWELAIGALLALRGTRLPLPEASRAPLGWIGIALMVVPFFVYDTTTPFPGLAAVPPCLGAMLVIWATDGGNSLLKKLLSLRPVVFVGLISYSLYLWHWPVKVFSHYWFTGLYSPLVMRVVVVAVSFGLAWLSWRYVEIPFRQKRGSRIRPLITGAVAASAVTLLVGATISWRDGLPGRFPPVIAQYDSAYEDRPEMEEADLTIEAAEQGNLPALTDYASHRGPSILLWGDSHARVVSPAVEAMCRELGIQGHRASRSATAPLLEWGEPEFRRYNAAILRWVETRRPTVVVLASRWEKVLRTPADEESLLRTVRTLGERGVSVAIMRQVASQKRDIPKSLARAALLGEDVDEVGIPVEEHAEATHLSNEMIDRVVAATPGMIELDPIPYLSRDGRCLAEEAGRPLYYDYQHLTRFGAQFLTPMFKSMMQSVEPRLSRVNASRRAHDGTTGVGSEGGAQMRRLRFALPAGGLAMNEVN